MKILLVSPYSSKKVGGIGTWTKIMLDYSRGRDDVSLLFLNVVQGLPKRWSLKNRLTHVVIGALDSLLILLRLAWMIAIYHPDIVHYTSSAASALSKDRLACVITRKLFRKAFIIHWRFGRIPELCVKKNVEFQLLMKVMKLSSISIVIDQLSYVALKKVGLSNVVCIPNPISDSIKHIAERLKVEDIFNHREKGTILYVGHMLPGKGIYELVKVCSELTSVTKLIMIGPFFDETVKAEVVKLAQNREKGEWLELKGELKREEVWEYYRKCGIFCLPSYTEGFPNVILEAMSFSCPIVATNVGAIPEMLEGDSGKIINPHDVSSLKAGLEEILLNTEKARTFALNAHKKVLANYTIETVFDKYKEEWEKWLTKTKELK